MCDSINEGDLHLSRTFSCDVTVTLTSITLSGGNKFRRSLLGDFATIITSLFFKVVLSREGLSARLIELGRGGSPRHTRF